MTKLLPSVPLTLFSKLNNAISFMFSYKTCFAFGYSHLASHALSDWPRSFSSLGHLSEERPYQQREEWLVLPSHLLLCTQICTILLFSCFVWSLWFFMIPVLLCQRATTCSIALQHTRGFLIFPFQSNAKHFSPFNQFIFRLFLKFVKNILNSNPILS